MPRSGFKFATALLAALLPFCGIVARAQSLSGALDRHGDLSGPANRRQAVEEMQRLENDRRTAAWVRAAAMGWPQRMVLPNGAVREKNRYTFADILPGNRVVFNIKGNTYRPIVKIHYNTGIVFIRFVGTHAEYDKIDATTI